MKVRAVLVVVLVLLSCGCARRRDDPYWAKTDRLSMEFDDLFRNALSAENDKQFASELRELQRLRRETALLPHPSYADEYQRLKVAEMDGWLGYVKNVHLHANVAALDAEVRAATGKGGDSKHLQRAQVLLEQNAERVKEKRLRAQHERSRILGLPKESESR